MFQRMTCKRCGCPKCRHREFAEKDCGGQKRVAYGEKSRDKKSHCDRPRECGCRARNKGIECVLTRNNDDEEMARRREECQKTCNYLWKKSEEFLDEANRKLLREHMQKLLNTPCGSLTMLRAKELTHDCQPCPLPKEPCHQPRRCRIRKRRSEDLEAILCDVERLVREFRVKENTCQEELCLETFCCEQEDDRRCGDKKSCKTMQRDRSRLRITPTVNCIAEEAEGCSECDESKKLRVCTDVSETSESGEDDEAFIRVWETYQHHRAQNIPESKPKSVECMTYHEATHWKLDNTRPAPPKYTRYGHLPDSKKCPCYACREKRRLLIYSKVRARKDSRQRSGSSKRPCPITEHEVLCIHGLVLESCEQCKPTQKKCCDNDGDQRPTHFAMKCEVEGLPLSKVVNSKLANPKPSKYNVDIKDSRMCIVTDESITEGTEECKEDTVWKVSKVEDCPEQIYMVKKQDLKDVCKPKCDPCKCEPGCEQKKEVSVQKKEPCEQKKVVCEEKKEECEEELSSIEQQACFSMKCKVEGLGASAPKSSRFNIGITGNKLYISSDEPCSTESPQEATCSSDLSLHTDDMPTDTSTEECSCPACVKPEFIACTYVYPRLPSVERSLKNCRAHCAKNKQKK